MRHLTFQLFVLGFLAATLITLVDARKFKSKEPTQGHRNFCGSSRKSIIDIDPSKATRANFSSFEFVNYDTEFPVSITYDGSTVKVEPSTPFPDNKVPSITGGGLNGRFNFAQFHFHWGNGPEHGIEHTISSEAYAAELHLVHYKSDYGSLSEAANHRDGVATLGVFIDEATNDEDELDIGPLNDLQQLFGRGRRLPRVATSTSLPLETYLPDDLDDFYSFSETPATPDCQQMATWILFSRPISFTTRQLESFRKLDGGDKHPSRLHSRPSQVPSNARIVFHRTEL